MNQSIPEKNPARRHFIKSALTSAALMAGVGEAEAQPTPECKPASAAEAFWGEHQAGIVSKEPAHTYFVAFDLITDQRGQLQALLQRWTLAAAELIESGAMPGLMNKPLSVTFGFGPSLFEKDGQDRFGLAAQRPAALVNLPRFVGDQLVPERTGGDLSVQVCAEDPLAVETAIRRLAKVAQGVAVMRWAQMGFNGRFQAHETPRNQMGFKDGTLNVNGQDPQTAKAFVWVGDEGPAWLRGGSYMVIRPIRISLEHWDDMTLAFQEQTIGRHKASGAPIGKQQEFEDLDLEREDAQGNPVLTENSHAAMSAPESNGGAQILRRAFSYDNGIAKIAERWPPWRQLVTFDAGLLFQCYQRDPRTGFIRLFKKMAQIDMLNQFTTHVGGGLFACPHGIKPGAYLGEDLFV